jgi:CRP-like cAMP-binding protein
MGAQSFLAVYAWRVNVHSIAWWNVGFVAINTVWVIVILRQRRAVTLTPELNRLQQRYFAALSPPEFLRFWRQGHHQTIDAGMSLAQLGTVPESLYFLLSGRVTVRLHPGESSLPAGHFVGEISLLTGDPSSADVSADGTVKAVVWPAADLRAIKGSDALLWTKIQSVLGHDLAEKLKRSARR